MCGIFGCLLKTEGDISTIIVNGIHKLLYRGYDSYGFVLDNTKVVRSLNAPENITYRGMLGIGHTRWATHGRPSIKNTHPIQSNDGKWFVVHNGVLQNHDLLKQMYNLSHSSETDSEIFVTLAEEIYSKNKNLTLIEVAKKVFAMIEGSYSVLLTSSEFPNEIIAACNGSPLAIASTDEGVFIASDSEALKDHSNKFITLDKRDFVHIDNHNYTFIANKEFQYIAEAITPELHHKHYMIKEILEQPSAIRSLMRGRVYENEVKLGGLAPYTEELRDASEWTFVGCGSSYNACLVVRPLIEEHFGKQKRIHCEQASDFMIRQASVKRSGVYFILSQSGETADCIKACEYIQKLGGKCFGINNKPGSMLDQYTCAGLHLNIGSEISVAATKSFTASLVSIMMICHMILKKDTTYLLKLPDILESHLNNDPVGIPPHMNKGQWWTIGDGYGYGMAREMALKLQEVCYLPIFNAMGFEVKHGPLALVDENTNFFHFGENRDVVKIMEARGAKEFSFTCQHVNLLTEIICDVISFQLLTYKFADAHNLPIDRPRNLAKSVTV